MIRAKKPRTLIEIGSGESTKVSLAALTKNESEGVSARFIAIEPYPQRFPKEITNKNFQLIERKVEEVDMGLLSTADILFI